MDNKAFNTQRKALHASQPKICINLVYDLNGTKTPIVTRTQDPLPLAFGELKDNID